MKKSLILLFILYAIGSSCEKEKEKKIDVTEKSYLLKRVSNDQSGIHFTNVLTESPERSIINYIYFYNGGGVAVGDINNDDLPDLYFVSNMGDNKLYLNKGDLKFQDITESSGIAGNSDWNTGVTMVDINNDGYLDIYVCAVTNLLGFKGKNELFINNGDNSFTERSSEYGLDFRGYSTQAYFFDYDKDDDLDVYIVNHAIHTTLSHGPADVRNKRVPLVGDVLLENINSKFVDVSERANIFGGVNGYGLSATIADFNNDGWDDIYVCNDFHEDDYYYINNGDGTFKNELDTSFSTISRFSMGSDAGDLNGDGYQDLITLDMLPKDEKLLKETEGDDAMFNMYKHLKKLGYKDQYGRNMLQYNNQGTYFYEAAFLNGIDATDWSWGPLIADYNNDGYQDVFISNGIYRRPNSLDFKKYVASAFKDRSPEEGLNWLYKSKDQMPKGDISNEIFEGNVAGLKNKTGDWIEDKPSLSNGAVYADLDLDGDLDIVLNNCNSEAGIYENTINNTKNFIHLKLSYKGQNKEGIGAKAIVYNGNKKQFKQLFKSRGFLSSVDNTLCFGMNNQVVIDSIEIIWPDDRLQTIQKPAINQKLVVNYSPSGVKYDYKRINTPPIAFKKITDFSFEHSEDYYDDFLNEKLIPYKVSTLGPAIAIADIDKNGYNDLFIGNASGKQSKLYFNNGIKMISSDQLAFEIDSLYEDNDAVFFDADNDNDLDLYVASGINKYRNKNFEADRLYIDQNGLYIRSNKRIPLNFNNTSCVEVYDYDNDGDLDIFVGNLSNPNDFGAPVHSYIYKNDGIGNFTIDKSFTLKSHVTGAKWVDLNDDGLKDLLVSTEWDTPKIYINNKGLLKLLTLPENLHGLWQSIQVYDIDNDNDIDIILGNWGLNTKFRVNEKAPLIMYHADFDLNGTNEVVLAYTKNGSQYPVNSKDELASQMNSINKRFVNYSDYALKTIDEVLIPSALKKAHIFEVQTLASGYLRNDNGKYNEFISFPDELQLAPINSFDLIELNEENILMISGNSLKVNTYHGGYTSLKGYLLRDILDFEPLSNFGIEPLDQQIKKIESLKMKNKNLLIVFVNNDSAKVYEY